MSHESVSTILVEVLCKTRVAARLVPKELNFIQKYQTSRYRHA